MVQPKNNTAAPAHAALSQRAVRDSQPEDVSHISSRPDDRRSELPRILPLWQHELADESLEGRRNVACKMAPRATARTPPWHRRTLDLRSRASCRAGAHLPARAGSERSAPHRPALKTKWRAATGQPSGPPQLFPSFTST